MMKLLVKLLVLVVLALLAYIIVRDDPGFVMVKYGEWIAEPHLPFPETNRYSLLFALPQVYLRNHC